MEETSGFQLSGTGPESYEVCWSRRKWGSARKTWLRPRVSDRETGCLMSVAAPASWHGRPRDERALPATLLERT